MEGKKYADLKENYENLKENKAGDIYVVQEEIKVFTTKTGATEVSLEKEVIVAYMGEEGASNKKRAKLQYLYPDEDFCGSFGYLAVETFEEFKGDQKLTREPRLLEHTINICLKEKNNRAFNTLRFKKYVVRPALLLKWIFHKNIVDVRQGELTDCWLIAAVKAMALSEYWRPKLTERIEMDGENIKVTLHLYNYKIKSFFPLVNISKTVTPYLPMQWYKPPDGPETKVPLYAGMNYDSNYLNDLEKNEFFKLMGFVEKAAADLYTSSYDVLDDRDPVEGLAMLSGYMPGVSEPKGDIAELKTILCKDRVAVITTKRNEDIYLDNKGQLPLLAADLEAKFDQNNSEIPENGVDAPHYLTSNHAYVFNGLDGMDQLSLIDPRGKGLDENEEETYPAEINVSLDDMAPYIDRIDFLPTKTELDKIDPCAKSHSGKKRKTN